MKKVCICKTCNPEGNYRYQIVTLAFLSMLQGHISIEEEFLYDDWFWELSDIPHGHESCESIYCLCGKRN